VFQSAFEDVVPKLNLVGEPLDIVEDDDERPICASEDLQKALCPSPVEE
jgi:hypothetical protein